MVTESIYFFLGIAVSAVIFMVTFIYFYVEHRKWVQRHEMLTQNLAQKLSELAETEKQNARNNRSNATV